MVIIRVTIKMPFAVLSFFVFTAQVKAIALISKEKLMAAVSNVLLVSIVSRK